jgi:hypothetical protein
MSKFLQGSNYSDSTRWKLSVLSALALVVLCLIPMATRVVMIPFIAAQNTLLEDKKRQFEEEQQKHGQEIQAYVEDKQRVAGILSGRRVGYIEASNWQPPYISLDADASPLARDIATYQDILARAKEYQAPRSYPQIDQPTASSVAQQTTYTEPPAGRFGKYLTPEDQRNCERNWQRQQEELNQAQQGSP